MARRGKKGGCFMEEENREKSREQQNKFILQLQQKSRGRVTIEN